MSQFGMQMPTGQARRTASMNVYTGLLFMAVLALFTACIYVGLIAGPRIGPNGNPLGMHTYDEAKKTHTITLSND